VDRIGGLFYSFPISVGYIKQVLMFENNNARADTFRWKGENCSTTEVTEVIATFPGIEEANVFGVLIPNNRDGRAPCVAITEKPNIKLDLQKLLAHAKKNLPPYAVPLFIRITPSIAVTATMKHQKVELRNEGIDIDKVKDPLFYLDDKKGYVPLTRDVYARYTFCCKHKFGWNSE